MRTDRALSCHMAALLGLGLACYALSTRYYTSAAFERPEHLSFLTLLFSALFLTAWSRWTGPSRRSRHLYMFQSARTSTSFHHSPATHGGFSGGKAVSMYHSGLEQVQRICPLFIFLLACIVARTFLFWSVSQKTQCAWSGIEAFLPFFVLVLDAIAPQTPRLPTSSRHKAAHFKNNHLSKISGSTLFYAVAALAWASSAMSALGHSRIATGVICPIGVRLEPLTPYAQLAMCVIDAAIIVCLVSVRRQDMPDDMDVPNFMATLFYVAAGCVLLLPLPTWLVDAGFIKAFSFHYIDVRDLILDSALASFALLCSGSLLTAVHPTTIAFVISSLGLFGFQIPFPKRGLLPSPQSMHESTHSSAMMAVLAGPLCLFALYPVSPSRPSMTTALHRSLLVGYVAILGACAVCWSLVNGPWTNLPIDTAVYNLMIAAKDQASRWQSQAAASQNLAEAVAEYKRRHGLPPPPHFDKWYDFAVQHGSPVIDDFGQINDDVLPFWGVSPADIRKKTSQLLSYSILEMGGFRIRDGAVQQSPHVPGTHRWMTDSLEKMVEPFAKWLPDMDIAINLADECRVAVPFDEMQSLKRKAHNSRNQTELRSKTQAARPQHESTKALWPTDFPEPAPRKHIPRAFTNNIRRQIFYDWVAASCPPDSMVQNSRWWDRSTVCLECLEPHSLLSRDGVVISNMSAAFDLCHQPDVAYLDGFVMSPSAMVGTKELLPVFSQGRVGGFSDILIPSPWNFNGKRVYDAASDLSWEKKKNGLFWRGSASDGFTSSGSWTSFVRARFVHEAYERASKPWPLVPKGMSGLFNEIQLAANVSFVGGMSKCTEKDCAAEMDAFEQWGSPAMSNPEQEMQGRLPQQVSFEEHWQYKHLVDMDGAGFSGRFLPFLESRSLVYRVALFRTWFDERLQPWYHYVPVDIRLGRGFWAVLNFFAGTHQNQVSKAGDRLSGSASAKDIAYRGNEWGRTALRPEDMQIYMFRLLLEWGRVVDDDREHLGFAG